MTKIETHLFAVHLSVRTMRIEIAVGKVMTERRRQKNESQTKKADVGSAIEFSESDVTRRCTRRCHPPQGDAPQGGKSGRKGGFALLRTCVNQKCYLSFHAFFCKEHGTRTFSLAPELFPVHCFCGSCLFFWLPLSVTICVLQNNDDIFIAS